MIFAPRRPAPEPEVRPVPMPMDLVRLHHHRLALRDEWMNRVRIARQVGHTADTFNAIGPILTGDNALWMFVAEHGRRTYDLGIDANGKITEVRS